jgi:peptidyl-prolyl cis-trans isomerase D
MGTFERIRQTSPYLLAIFAVVFVGFFVISDLDPSSLMNRGLDYQSAAIAEVNGEKILYKDYADNVNNRIEQQRQQNPDPEMEINQVQIQKDIWNEMLEDLILKQQADKAGIFVSVGELRDVLLENPPDYLRRPFTDSAGNFDKRSYQEIITNPESIIDRLPQTMSQMEKRSIVEQYRQDLISIEELIRKQKLMESLQLLVGKSNAIISNAFAEQEYINNNSTATVEYIYFNPRNVSDKEIEVTDKEIQEYYNKHKEEYDQEAQRKLKFLAFQIRPNDKDSAAADKNIQRLSRDFAAAKSFEERDSIFTLRFREMRGELHDYKFITDIDAQKAPYITSLQKKEVVGPIVLRDGTYFFRLEGTRTGENMSVKASHILVLFNQNKDSALAEAKKIKSEVNSMNFALKAAELSEDKGSARQGGDLGYFGKDQMVKPFEEAAFAAEVGSIVGPVESQFGYHIIYVEDKKSEELSFSEIKITPTVSRMTRKRIAREAKEFQLDLEQGMDFDSAAAKYERPARETQFFTIEQPVLGSMYLSAKAFELELGDLMGPMELDNYGIIVARVVEVLPKGYAPLDFMRDKIITKILEQKKIELLEPRANDVYNKLKNLGSFAEFNPEDPTLQMELSAEIKKNGLVPKVGRDITLTSQVFNLAEGKISSPIKGDRGYYIVKVINKNVPTAQQVQENLANELSKMQKNANQSAYFQWFNAVKNNADIKDHRSKFYKEY